MIKLKEILHTISEENKEDLTELDNWKITDYDFMTDMDFKPDGMYTFSLKNPSIRVHHKKGAGFVVNDKSKEKVSIFPTFGEMSEYFTQYEQKWQNTPYR